MTTVTTAYENLGTVKDEYKPIGFIVKAILGEGATIKHYNDIDKILKCQKLICPGDFEIRTKFHISENDKGKPYLDGVTYLINQDLIRLLDAYVISLMDM